MSIVSTNKGPTIKRDSAINVQRKIPRIPATKTELIDRRKSMQNESTNRGGDFDKIDGKRRVPSAPFYSFHQSLSGFILLANLSLNYFLSAGNEEETMVDTCSRASLFITPLFLLCSLSIKTKRWPRVVV